MALFLGLDSGGTKTECWVGTESAVLGRATCATVKLTRVGQEVATERIAGLLADVEQAAGINLRDVRRSCVGIAGYSIAGVRQWVERVVRERVGGEVEVVGDQEIALDAAFQGGPGILLIAGTGSFVVGRGPAGEQYTVGGWGPAIGDEGSGWWIGAQGVRAAFHALDREQPEPGGGSELLEAIRKAWGVEDRGAVVGFANMRPGPDFAALAPVMVSAAADGNRVALQVLQQAGELLAEAVTEVWKRLRGAGLDEAEVAYTGSVVERIPMVRDRMRTVLERDCPALTLRQGSVNSMEGALWRARRGPVTH